MTAKYCTAAVLKAYIVLCLKMEAKHAEGIGMPVSVWTSLVKSDEGTKCVVVLEPVQKIAASATISQDVCIV